MLIEGMDYVVRMMSLPGDIHAAVTFDPDGRANIYVNAGLSPEAQRRALDHEMCHVARDDMYSHMTILDAENEALMVSRAPRMVFAHVFGKYITRP